MKTLLLVLGASALVISASAQTPEQINAANATRTVTGASARDGFTLRGTEAVITRNGITTKVEREMILPNGVRVLPNGNVKLRDGTTSALRSNQLLTFEGTFQDVVLTPQGVAPLSSVDPGPAPKAAVSLSSRDGIFTSGKEVFISRNGVTEKVTSDFRLPNGVVVKPSGIVVLGTGNTVTLRPDQMLDLNGVLHDAPVRATGRTK